MPKCFLHIFPIVADFDRDHQLIHVTNSNFQVQECFSDSIFFDHPCSIRLFAGMINPIRPTRAMTFWTDGFTNHELPSHSHTALLLSLGHSPCLPTTAADWLSLPSPSPKVSRPQACPSKFRSTSYLAQTSTKSSPNQPSPHHAEKPGPSQHAPKPSLLKHTPNANLCPSQHASQPSPPEYTQKTKAHPPYSKG